MDDYAMGELAYDYVGLDGEHRFRIPFEHGSRQPVNGETVNQQFGADVERCGGQPGHT
jgi:hypothetical protein